VKFVIPLRPITKKNNMQVIKNRKTGRPMVIQSKQYLQYEKDCQWFMPNVNEPIDYPVNVKCLYYMPTRNIVDLVNLQNATLDILVKYGILKDDNYKIVVSMDGSRVLYDKESPRTEVEICRVRQEK
jgi:Holliday junction resolvase RusA-like endonuclease